jgi:hypothetical protein
MSQALHQADQAAFAMIVIDLGESVRADDDGVVRAEGAANPDAPVAPSLIDDGTYNAP